MSRAKRLEVAAGALAAAVGALAGRKVKAFYRSWTLTPATTRCSMSRPQKVGASRSIDMRRG